MYNPSYRTKKNGVPVLSKEHIDIIAESFIKDFSPDALKEPQPIDIDSFIMNYLKLKQDFQYLSHCGVYLGMMVFNDTRRVVVYDPYNNKAEYIAAKQGTVIIDNTLLEEGQEHRYRFTMGHEGGHWIFHRDVFWQNPNQTSFFDPPRDAIVKCRAVALEGKPKPFTQWTDHDRMEWQSNYMSSALMMPKSMVLALYNEGWLRKIMNDESPYMQALFPELLISTVAQTFNVSNQASEIRLKNLGLMQ